ncbi:MAG: hypothetical protein LAO05_08535 [Acidobacteriia bacterium]|nr:hypothetical protein [Terriglobia bacterium]
MTTDDPEPLALGRLVTNLQSLEFVLRLLLHDLVGPKTLSLDLEKLSVGETVPENPITNYDSFGDVIRKVNELLEAHAKPERIDPSLAHLRDAIAHGRVLASHPTGPFSLVKFSKPKAGVVKVTVAEQLTLPWLDTQIKRTYSEITKARAAARSLGLSCFPGP